MQPVALLPDIARGLGVSEGSVGVLLTAYAGLAAATAIPLTAWASRIGRRPLVLATVLTLVVSQAAAALAPSYAALVVARLLCALAHGVFWSIVAQVAAALVAPDQAGRATAAVFAGNSLALVLGTPLVTALGSATGWRVAVAVVGTLGALVALALFALLPATPARAAPRDRARTAFAALADRSLLSVCGVTMAVVIGQFIAFTYFAPIVSGHTGLDGAALSAVFLAYGAAGVVGVVLVGATTDRRPRRAVLGCCVALTLAMALLAALTTRSIPLTLAAVLVWGAAFTALPICLQAAVLRVAPRAPDTASALYVVAFQIGIGGGALLGALLVDSHHLPDLTRAALLVIAAGTLAAAASRSAFPARG